MSGTSHHVFDPLPSATLRDQIARQIRDAILAGDLAPGERLVERQLAEQFGSGLSAVREALIELEARGLVVRRRNAATHVVQLSAEQVEQIFEVRRVLEGYVIEELARRLDPETSAHLRPILERMHLAAERDAAREFQDLTVEFHMTAWRLVNNGYLLAALERTVLPYFEDGRLRAVSQTAHGGGLDAYERSLRSHLAVLEAIETGDPVVARRAFDEAVEGWYLHALRAGEGTRGDEDR